MSAVLLTIFLLLLAWAVKKAADALATGRQKAPYPPGPPPKPLVGNMFDFPLVDAAQEYIRWGEKYNSDILYLNALGNRIVVLNKREDVEELLERRARKYSDRPSTPIIKLIGWQSNSGLLRYGDEWRMHRKIFEQNFRAQVVQKYYPLQLRKVHQLLRGLLETPEAFDQHTKLLPISLTLYTMYGYEVDSIDDPCVSAAEKSVKLGLSLLLPGSSFIPIIPALAYVPTWFPGAYSRKKAAEVLWYTEEMQRIPMDIVKKRVSEGTAVPSLVSDFLESKNNVGASEEEEMAFKNVAYTVYGSSSNSTYELIMTFYFLIAAHPDVQKKAQAEIDGVVGSKRLPDFEERSSLPYIDAIYREVMRWMPPGPLGAPHCSTEDDYYKGYLIPKGTNVFGNIWAMTHDPEVYPEPSAFKPERFLDPDGKLNDDDWILAYGFGRRVCPGKYMASTTLWLIMVSVLASFNIGKAKDESGNEMEINDQFEEYGLTFHKTPFKCSWTPRSSAIAQLIAETKYGKG